jgi:hypothetical protein
MPAAAGVTALADDTTGRAAITHTRARRGIKEIKARLVRVRQLIFAVAQEVSGEPHTSTSRISMGARARIRVGISW